MPYWKRFLSVSLVWCLLLIMLVGCQKTSNSPEPQTPTNPAALPTTPLATLTVSPDTATIGKPFGLTITGRGFEAGEQVRVFVSADLGGSELGLELVGDAAPWASSDSSGAFTAATEKSNGVPILMKPGIYTVKAVGQKSKTTAATSLNIVEVKK